MAMLKEIFTNQNSLANSLQAAKNKIYMEVQNKKSKANIIELEKELNDIFYPPHATQISTEYLLELMASTTTEELVNIAENFDFTTSTGNYVASKEAMLPSTLQKAIDSAIKTEQVILERLTQENSVTSIEKLSNMSQQINQLAEQGKQIMKSPVLKEYFGQQYLYGESYTSAVQVVNALLSFSNAFAALNGLTQKEIGEIFEKALAKTNFVESGKAIMEQEIEKVWTGANSQIRGKIGPIEYTVEGDIRTKVKNGRRKTEILSPKDFTMTQKGMKITYKYDPSAPQQGKMDVQLHYNASNAQDYRVSAKRWSLGSGDLGETSIDAGLSRTAGDLSVVEAYKLAVLKPTKDQWKKPLPNWTAYELAHDLAQYAVKADIAMGIGQGDWSNKGGGGYANILVIDTSSHIVVRDLADIVEDKKLAKYDANTIENAARLRYNAIYPLKTGRTNAYLALMTSVLNQMKTTINLSVS